MHNDPYNFTSREDFVETWLTEIPARLGNFGETFSMMEKSISDWIQSGHRPERLTDTLFRLVGQNMAYYWFQVNDDIVIAAELEQRPQGSAVNVVGKNPRYQNQPPYATDLYLVILDRVPNSLLFSDAQLSDDGIALWKRLLQDPDVTVSVYDRTRPGESFRPIERPEDLDAWLGPQYSGYRFVLSRKNQLLSETKSYFNLRRYRELAGAL